MYKYYLTRPRANIDRIHLWTTLEELAPHDALFWWGEMRNQIIYKHKRGQVSFCSLGTKKEALE